MTECAPEINLSQWPDDLINFGLGQHCEALFALAIAECKFTRFTTMGKSVGLVVQRGPAVFTYRSGFKDVRLSDRVRGTFNDRLTFLDFVARAGFVSVKDCLHNGARRWAVTFLVAEGATVEGLAALRKDADAKAKEKEARKAQRQKAETLSNARGRFFKTWHQGSDIMTNPKISDYLIDAGVDPHQDFGELRAARVFFPQFHAPLPGLIARMKGTHDGCFAGLWMKPMTVPNDNTGASITPLPLVQPGDGGTAGAAVMLGLNLPAKQPISLPKGEVATLYITQHLWAALRLAQERPHAAVWATITPRNAGRVLLPSKDSWAKFEPEKVVLVGTAHDDDVAALERQCADRSIAFLHMETQS